MTANTPENRGFMFSAKDVYRRGIYIPPFGGHGKHTFAQTFTTGKPYVSRVCRYAQNGEHGKLTNMPRPNFRMMGKGVRR
jgi:hypothetical protein